MWSLRIFLFFCLSCPAHQEYLTCGTECPRNCDNYRQDAVMCTKNCRAACYCRSPYIFRSGRSGLCVLPAGCPRGA